MRSLFRRFSERKGLGATLMAAADITAKVAAFLITPYLANRMGPTEFGSLNLYLASTDIIAFALFLGGPALVASECVRSGQSSALQVRSASLGVAFRILPILLIFCVSASLFWPSRLPLTIALLVVTLSYLYGLNSLEISFYRGAQKYPLAVAGQFSFTALSLLITISAFQLLQPTAVNRLLSIVLALALIQIVYDGDLRRLNTATINQRTRRQSRRLVITFGLSISAHVIGHWIRMSVDRYFLAGYTSLAGAGIYSLALSMAMVPSVFFSVVSQQLQPYLYRQLKDGRFSQFRRSQTSFIFLAILATVIYYGVLMAFFDKVFSSDYSAAKDLIIPLLGGALAQAIYFIFSHAAFYERRGRHISVVAVLTLTVHLSGLTLLVLLSAVNLFTVAVVYLISGLTATVAMAVISNLIVKRLESSF